MLERCEVRHGGPCVLVVVDEDIKYASGDQIKPRPMPRVHYAGSFNPERIPSLPADVRRRPDVVGYVSAPNFKAAAYHSIGRIFIITSAPSQLAAEEQVLTACNNDPSRQNKSGHTVLFICRGHRYRPLASFAHADRCHRPGRRHPRSQPSVIEPVKPPSVIVPRRKRRRCSTPLLRNSNGPCRQ